MNINGRPALRVGDKGIHAACCGPNQWQALRGAPTVFINGQPAHRVGDRVQHCGGVGQLVEGSPNVNTGDFAGVGIGAMRAAGQAGAEPGSLTVMVTDRHTREPLAGAQVRLVDLGLQTTADAAGRAHFARVPTGQHVYRVRAAGSFGRKSSAYVNTGENTLAKSGLRGKGTITVVLKERAPRLSLIPAPIAVKVTLQRRSKDKRTWEKYKYRSVKRNPRTIQANTVVFTGLPLRGSFRVVVEPTGASKQDYGRASSPPLKKKRKKGHLVKGWVLRQQRMTIPVVLRPKFGYVNFTVTEATGSSSAASPEPVAAAIAVSYDLGKIWTNLASAGQGGAARAIRVRVSKRPQKVRFKGSHQAYLDYILPGETEIVRGAQIDINLVLSARRLRLTFKRDDGLLIPPTSFSIDSSVELFLVDNSGSTRTYSRVPAGSYSITAGASGYVGRETVLVEKEQIETSLTVSLNRIQTVVVDPPPTATPPPQAIKLFEGDVELEQGGSAIRALGQKIILRVRSADPSGTLTSIEWTGVGYQQDPYLTKVIKDYNPATGAIEYLSASAMQGETLEFYWIAHERFALTVSAYVNSSTDKSSTKYTFDVKSPELSKTTGSAMQEEIVANFSRASTELPPKDNKIKPSISAALWKSTDQGSLGLLRLIQVKRFEGTGRAQDSDTGFLIYSGGITAPIPSSLPEVVVKFDRNIPVFSVKDKFHYYLMYKSATTASIWVAIRRWTISWAWNATFDPGKETWSIPTVEEPVPSPPPVSIEQTPPPLLPRKLGPQQTLAGLKPEQKDCTWVGEFEPEPSKWGT